MPPPLHPWFYLSARLKATEGFVWDGSARRLDFGCSGEPCSPDAPFDQVTPSPSALIIHRQGCESTRASVAELQAYLWTVSRPSQEHRHQMLSVTCLPALQRCQLGFLFLYLIPAQALSSSLAAGHWVFPPCRAVCLTEASQNASSCFALRILLIILIFTLNKSLLLFV